MTPDARTPADRRPDASMTLLTSMLQRPLDPGYAASAKARVDAGLPSSTSLRAPRLVVATLAIGLVVGIAAAHLTSASVPRSQARADLITEVQERRAEVDALATRAVALQAEVTALEAEQLGGDTDAVTRGQTLASAVGSIPLTGPGVVLTLDDAPGAGADEADEAVESDDAAEGRVFARDLQFVTNALWQAGAEAVSINGKRLTSTSAIRFAGSAIIVDFRPLARPYVVTAIGDPQRFPAAFADGPGGTYLSTLRSTFGVRVDTEVRPTVTVPAAVGITTRYARTGDTGAPDPAPSTSSATPTPERSPS